MDSWLTHDAEVRVELASVAGEAPSAEIQDQFLNLYLLLGIFKDGLNYYLQEKEYKSESEPVKAKNSTKRLIKRADSLLTALNEMVSHEIHASMVMKIMTLEHSDILSLQASALQLLLDKTPDFNLQLS